MKLLQHFIVMLFITLSTTAYSQSPKTKIFSGQPDKFICNSNVLSEAFTAREGQTIRFDFDDNVSFTGKVISNIVKYDNLQSMTIQLPDYNNAVFHLSKQINPDKTINYVGRIIQKDAADGYIIERTANTYSFNKIETETILQVCQ